MWVDLALFLFLGLVFGSFVSSLTWRLPRSGNFGGRSLCPKCKSKIAWYDNIPILSFFNLHGRCRNCGKKISPRYPLMEGASGVIFAATGASFMGYLNFSAVESSYKTWMGDFALPYFLFIFLLFLAIAVIDIEHMIIPDSLVFWGIALSFVVLLFSPQPALFNNFFWAGAASMVPLSINLLTRGAGMGLGDVKLAFLLGLVFGSSSPAVFFIATLSGAVLGIIFVFLKRVNIRQPIPFGPFLIFGAFVVFFFGRLIEETILLGV